MKRKTERIKEVTYFCEGCRRNVLRYEPVAALTKLSYCETAQRLVHMHRLSWTWGGYRAAKREGRKS